MYYFDSCVLIEFLRGNMPQVRELLISSDPRLFKVPAVVKAELLLGAEKSQKKEANRLLVEKLLLPFEVVSFDERCAYVYAQLRANLELAGTSIGPNDTIIAATILANDGVLITNNLKEFQRIPNLKIEKWDEIIL